MENTLDSIASAGKRLMYHQPFYALLLLTLDKRINKTAVPTAGVGIQGINTVLTVNPTFWDEKLAYTDDRKKTRNHRMGILLHELLHVAFFHIQNRGRFLDKKLANIAMDLEINQYIPRDWLPGGEFDQKTWEKMVNDVTDQANQIKEDFEAGTITEEQAAEQLKALPELPPRALFFDEFQFNASSEGTKGTKYYYDRLQQQLGTGSNPALDAVYGAMEAGVPTIADHPLWDDVDDMDEVTKELTKSQVDYQLKEVAKEIMKSQGHIPNELRGTIDELLDDQGPVINWRQELRKLAGSSYKTEVRKTRRRQSYRHPDSPRLIIKNLQNVLFAVDTSGSMSDRELAECFLELGHVSKAGVSIEVIECDAAIGRIYSFNKKGDQGTKISGGGGTSFDPVVDYYNENREKYSILIYFTDGYAGVPMNPPLKPMLWLLSSTGYSKEAEQFKEEGFPGGIVKMIRDWDED